MNQRPNILFIMTDEQRFDTFSHNNSEVITPQIDKLINNSIFFEHAYCSNPSCIPSRAAMVTGKYPTQCQVPTYITKLPENEVTFMTRLQKAGYHTAVVGKQHFAHSKIKRGYDEEWIIDGHSPGGFPAEIKIYTDYLKAEGVYDDKFCSGDLMIGGSWLLDMKYHIDSFVAKLGLEWIDKQVDGDKEQDKPWFFTLSFPGPHMPYDCEGTPYAKDYKLENISMPETTYEDLDNKPPHFKKLKEMKYIKNHNDKKFLKTKRAYYANMTLIDEKVGQVVDLLKEKGLYDNTLIIYTADHGDFMGDFGMVSKAQYLTEGLMRVPLFVKPPIKEFKGFNTMDKVLNIDLAATCLEVANGELGYGMSDYSWVNYWKNDESVRVRDYIYYEAGGMKAVIKNGIKVVHYEDRDYGELYDLNIDPIEKYNLWDEDKWQNHKSEARGIIINQMIKMTPKSEIKWNVNDPSI